MSDKLRQMRHEFDTLEIAARILRHDAMRLIIEYRIIEYNKKLTAITKEEQANFQKQLELMIAIKQEESKDE